MVKRIVAIIMIFIATSVAWMGLGLLTQERTRSTYYSLQGQVADLWGAEHRQVAPAIFYEVREKVPGPAPKPGEAAGEKEIVREIPTIPESSDIKVNLKLDQRKKGLLWYSTYFVSFAGNYTLRNDTGESRRFIIKFSFPTPEAIYDNFSFKVDGREVGAGEAAGAEGTAKAADVMTASVPVQPGEVKPFSIAYDSRGLDRWFYQPGQGVSQVKNFRLEMTTDFKAIDFPGRTISPTAKEEIPGGWKLTWEHKNLISGFQLGMEMPRKLNPGPLASQISFFAPVTLLFFFFIIFVLSVLQKIRLHPMHYFFLAAAFFSFHLLFAYLVDHLNVHLSFAIASLTSVALVVSYLRLVVGNRFAFLEAGLAQLVYLVLFSYAHFFKGYTGLTVTLGSIVTLAVLMQMTARVDWDEYFHA